MHANSNESGENIHKNTNTQPIQINATAKDRSNVTVDDITYKRDPTESDAKRRTLTGMKNYSDIRLWKTDQ